MVMATVECAHLGPSDKDGLGQGGESAACAVLHVLRDPLLSHLLQNLPPPLRAGGARARGRARQRSAAAGTDLPPFQFFDEEKFDKVKLLTLRRLPRDTPDKARRLSAATRMLRARNARPHWQCSGFLDDPPPMASSPASSSPRTPRAHPTVQEVPAAAEGAWPTPAAASAWLDAAGPTSGALGYRLLGAGMSSSLDRPHLLRQLLLLSCQLERCAHGRHCSHALLTTAPVYLSVYLSICLSIYLSIYMCVCIYIYMYMCVYVCVCVRVCVCVCVCVCMCIYTHTYIHNQGQRSPCVDSVYADDGGSLLHKAAARGLVDAARLLVEFGARDL